MIYYYDIVIRVRSQMIQSVAYDNYDDDFQHCQLHILRKNLFQYFEDYLMTQLILG
jgi:hypothetical protein